MINLKVKLAGVEFENPVMTASGTFGFGREYGEYFDLNELGAICVKGLTLEPREGNPPPRIAETPAGILNSVGLQNPGVKMFLKSELPQLKEVTRAKIIANMAGNTIEEYCEMASILSESSVDMLEMNISCPNVAHGGAAFGSNPDMVFEITSRVRAAAKKPLIVKLSPNVTDITEVALAAEQGGADALSLINTLLGMAIDIKTRRPILKRNVGGLSGPAVKPVAVRMVWQAANAVRIPVIGMGGIASWEDAVEFLLAGAKMVSVGCGMFREPALPVTVKNGIAAYMEKNNFQSVEELSGAVQVY